MWTFVTRLRAVSLAALALPLALAACSSSDNATVASAASDGGASATDSGSASTPFERFCTGTSLRTLRLMAAGEPGAWELASSELPAGSSFLVGIESSGLFAGYATTGTGTVRVDGSVATGLVLGTDFSSSCVTTPQSASKLFTVLEDSTFYADKAKTGTPCAVRAGTTFEEYSFSGGVPASLSATALSTACGFTLGYTSDLVFGKLVVK